jgi:hypothetical protein
LKVQALAAPANFLAQRWRMRHHLLYRVHQAADCKDKARRAARCQGENKARPLAKYRDCG